MASIKSLPNTPGGSTHRITFASSLSVDEQKAFANYWEKYCSNRRAGDPFLLPPLERPYWMLLPEWLLRKSDAGDVKNTLEEILTAQYFLFIAFRIHDNILDEETPHLQALRSVSNEFLREAERIFERLFPKSSVFWDRYPGLIAETTDAIAKSDILQRAPASSPEQLLDEYARINSVFLAGSWAACVLNGRYEEFECVKSFADQLSCGAQMLDDYYDMTEDLNRGRFNYVLNELICSSHALNPEASVGEIPAESLDRILLLVEGHYRAAYAKLEGMQIPESSLYAEEYIQRLETIRSDLRARQPGVVKN